MNKNKSSISKAQSHEEIGEFWDTHDLADHWEETRPAEFEVDLESELTYYAVDSRISAKIQTFAKKRGISQDTLLNLWLQKKIQEQNEI
ncbi:MAG: CopG family antitoxin [Methanosarcinales archaeon]